MLQVSQRLRAVFAFDFAGPAKGPARRGPVYPANVRVLQQALQLRSTGLSGNVHLQYFDAIRLANMINRHGLKTKVARSFTALLSLATPQKTSTKTGVLRASGGAAATGGGSCRAVAGSPPDAGNEGVKSSGAANVA